MTLRKFIRNLNKFVEKNPESLSMQVVTSIDNEGNGYNFVHYSPTKGVYKDGNFISFEEYDGYDIDNSETNAVCIN